MYTELVVAGILLAMLYFELTQFSPGGLVTPVYLALCLSTPVRIVHTVVVVALTWAVMRLVGRVWIVYGKRYFAISVAVSFLLDALLGILFPVVGGLRAIGYIVPALMVRDIERQGLRATALSCGIVTLLCVLPMLWAGVL